MDLYRKTRELERCNAELEQRVLERTAALRRSKEQLEARIEERTREREKDSAPDRGTAIELWLPQDSGYPTRRNIEQGTGTGLNAR